MDAIALLKQDHAVVEELFTRYEATGPRALKERRKLVDQLVIELSRHAALEEQLLYPALRLISDEGNELALEAIEEHHVVKWTLEELRKLDVAHEHFDAKVKVLTTNVRHHIKEEHNELFPLLRKALERKELLELGEQMERMKAIAPTRPHPRAPAQPPGNLIAGPMAGVLDRSRDLLMGRRSAPRAQAAKVARAPTRRQAKKSGRKARK